MKRITAVGEILFDIYTSVKKMGGAPLNFIYHIHKFSGATNMISRIGNDELGGEILRFLEGSGISTRYIQVDPNHPTGTATVKLNEKGEPSFTINSETAYDFIEANNELNILLEENTDCLYFGSLAQRNKITQNTIHSLLGKNIKYFCDLNIRQNFYNKDTIIKSLSATDVLKVNEDELKLLNDLLFNEKLDFEKTSIKLMREFDIEMIAVTKGADGSILIREEINEFSIEPINVIDTVGSGDAFAAVLCLGYLNGWKLHDINKIANSFASEICMINGALPADNKIYEKFRAQIETE